MRMPGVEPGSQAWEACMMPLHYMRLGGSEFLRQRSAWAAHLTRTFAAQAKGARPSGQRGVAALTKKTTPVGFEPTRGDPIGLAGRRLNHSAKVSIWTEMYQEMRMEAPYPLDHAGGLHGAQDVRQSTTLRQPYSHLGHREV